MLRKIRIVFATIFCVAITLLLLDFTGSVHAWFGWMAKIQLLPAFLALNFGIVAAIAIVTLLFGRIYCSVICPLGVMQDGISNMAGRIKKNRFAYSPAKRWLRLAVLVAFVLVAALGGMSLAATIAPYSAYARMVQSLLAPLWMLGNNALAYLAERADSYAFYTVDVWMKGAATLGVAAATFVIIALLAWRGGRTWCNTVCPVGTLLGGLSRFAIFQPVIDTGKCNGCKLCERNCKASCIDSQRHIVDGSRCVDCFNCIDKCRQGAISYRLRTLRPATKASAKPNACDATTPQQEGMSRRKFLSLTALLTAGTLVRAEEKKVDGGLAVIADRKIPARTTRIVPAGAHGQRHFSAHCTGCQLCVAVCPNGVLRPSGNLSTLMQPEMSYERGYCRPECTKCSEVCPTGAIGRVSRDEKAATQIGRAVWIRANCVPLTDGVECGNCARHCPSGAITMIASADGGDAPKIPSVDTERCIGCGACENLCPARPFSAIYIEGHEQHRTI